MKKGSASLLRRIYRGILPVFLQDLLSPVASGFIKKKHAKIGRAVETMVLKHAQEGRITLDPNLHRIIRQHGFDSKEFIQFWEQQRDDGAVCYNFAGALLPVHQSVHLSELFQDVLLVSCLYQDNYDASFVDELDRVMLEGPYGYHDGSFDVTVKSGDVVIDAGSNIGDFSAYAASKGAAAYAFEPVESTFRVLQETAELNSAAELNGGKIVPVPMGLSDTAGTLQIPLLEESGANSIVTSINESRGKQANARFETVKLTTLDQFVEERAIKKVDFIKADIEGAERLMLSGAANVLKTFAPKLAICTYHFLDDPQVLEALILKANPSYTVKHLRHKLFAAVC
jgi:FkbM family methyltransferase